MKRKTCPTPRAAKTWGSLHSYSCERHPWKVRVSLELMRFGLCPGPPTYPAQPPLPQAECAAWPLTLADRA